MIFCAWIVTSLSARGAFKRLDKWTAAYKSHLTNGSRVKGFVNVRSTRALDTQQYCEHIFVFDCLLSSMFDDMLT